MSSRSRRGAAVGITLALGLGLVPALAGTASATPDAKHGPSVGHLPAQQQNVRLVGEAKVAPRPSTTPLPEGADSPLEGRIADVNVFGNYAYLAAFREPTCENGGVFVVDVTDPTKPVEVPGAFIPASPDTYVGEGVQVIEIGARDVLLFNNEPCSATAGKGGLSLIDVTDPRNPVPLAMNVGDTDSPDGTGEPVHSIHSVYGWNDGGRAYALLVDNVEEADVDIFDITDPTAPVKVSETSYVDDLRVVQADPPNGDSQFLHDVVVKEINGVQTMLASYWDNGYLIIDVDNPAAPRLLRDTDFAATEPFAAELGLPAGFEPEGNAHQGEFSPNNQFFIGTDEDFNPFRVTTQVSSGANAGYEDTAANGSGTPPVTDTDTLSGTTDFVGRGCTADPYPAKSGDIAVIERGACTFQEKYDKAVAAGYTGVIIFNSTGGCDALINPSVTGDDVPFVFVTRSTGLAILNQTIASNPCAQASPATGGTTGDVDIQARFDGWGYVHLFDANTMRDLDQYAIDESLDPDFATGFGDLSVHEVAVDPKNPGRAYLSYYSGGLRVIEYGGQGIREIGSYISQDGSNLWGVEFWTSPTTGQDYVLGSDRDSGLQVFQFDAGVPDVTAAISPDPIAVNATTATVSGTVTDADTSTVQIGLRDSAGKAAATQTVTIDAGGDDYSVTFDVSGFAAGTVTATVIATDVTGKVGIASDTATKSAAAAPPSPPASPPASPPPGGACATPATVQLGEATIIATGSSGVTVTAPANQTVDLFAYTRPSTTYRLVRSGVTGADGKVAFAPVRPPANTRLYAQVRGCTANIARDSVVLNVRTALSLFAVRNGTQDYTFSGDSLPARPGGLIVSLYRVTDAGRQVLTAQTRASATTGEWTINRTFTGTGRFGFVVRTGQDLQNAPGTSNVRPTLIF